ncbi:helix-turn-helix transcriptional regulator [Intestinibacillus massiliensis]|uniref:helix-turn-helix transcriptional regulator n=1 Tax=Intestinibacillus massiliensis TaxID=1871029 RepID=UPI000B35F4B0|nr:helix-turn-helix domain-containing protein [Intestinibacillus massiliensis]
MPLFMFKNDTQNCFDGAQAPQLVFVSDVETAYSKMALPLHSHAHLIEIAYVYKGSGTHFIGSRSYTVREGDILIFNAGVVHDDSSLPDSVEGLICLGFTGLQIDGLPENHLIPPDAAAVVSTGEHMAEAAALFRMVYRQMEDGRELCEDFCNAALRAILLLLRQLLGSGEERLCGKEHELVGSIKAYIDRNYAEPLTLSGIADVFYINPYYASHIFKAVTGYSPIQYITRRRIGEAQSLLTFTSHSVTEVAAMVGYDNPNYFSTVFSKLVGMSPVKYRQSWENSRDGLPGGAQS